MSRDVSTSIETYKEDGFPDGQYRINVHSHSDHSKCIVVIPTKDGNAVTHVINAADIIAAVKNATNFTLNE